MKTVQQIAEALEAARRVRQLDYQAIADRAGLTPLSVRQVLQGKTAPRITTLMAIAAELGLEVLLLPTIVAQGLESQAASADAAPPLSQVDRIVAQTSLRAQVDRKGGASS